MRSHGTGGTGISSVPEGVEGHGETEAVVYSENVKSNVLRAEGIRLDEHDSKWGFPRKGSLRQLPPPLLLRARARACLSPRGHAAKRKTSVRGTALFIWVN